MKTRKQYTLKQGIQLMQRLNLYDVKAAIFAGMMNWIVYGVMRGAFYLLPLLWGDRDIATGNVKHTLLTIFVLFFALAGTFVVVLLSAAIILAQLKYVVKTLGNVKLTALILLCLLIHGSFIYVSLHYVFTALL
ncbi:hypothetical protein [Longirhabdus pacifica]|uniref:hypothetical protein n=1 Tax=Longirhabdus pacifica TaxID=2305227 RepID=UPI001008BFEE|nr:hypothetical protein [Longirhabdus pacifica]